MYQTNILNIVSTLSWLCGSRKTIVLLGRKMYISWKAIVVDLAWLVEISPNQNKLFQKSSHTMTANIGLSVSMWNSSGSSSCLIFPSPTEVSIYVTEIFCPWESISFTPNDLFLYVWCLFSLICLFVTKTFLCDIKIYFLLSPRDGKSG